MLADLIDRLVHSFKGIAPLAVAFGCQSEANNAPESAPIAIVAPKPVEVTSVKPADKPIGSFSITFYYVVTEEEVLAKKPAAANDNQTKPVTSTTTPIDKSGEGRTRSSAEGDAKSIDETDPELAAIAAPEQVTLYASNGAGRCEPISEVSREFASQLALQGTGKLKDGRVLNIWGNCNCGHSPCFKVTAATWGTGGTGRQLQPFRTVAVDPRVIKLGALLYVPLLEGKLMPGRAPWGGYVHDGCVVADDVGGGIKGTQLDLFVGRKGWFLGMSGRGGSHEWARQVPVFDGSKRCERSGRRVARRAGAI
ncbi:MAG: 3D domain-containing protein [Kofleriaceae bacterium]